MWSRRIASHFRVKSPLAHPEDWTRGGVDLASATGSAPASKWEGELFIEAAKCIMLLTWEIRAGV